MQGVFLVPILTSLGTFALIFGIVYLKSRENMAMIEKGMNPKQKMNSPAPFNTLKFGLLLLGAGIGLFMAYFIDRNLPERVIAGEPFHHDNAAIYFALVAVGGGLGLVVSYLIERKYLTERKESLGTGSV